MAKLHDYDLIGVALEDLGNIRPGGVDQAGHL